MSDKKLDDGGPEYPQYRRAGDVEVATGGMSLRDHFGGLAMAAFLTSPAMSEDACLSEERCAGWAYSMADAMLAERAKEPTT